jgi:uncharacterized protein YllA (UPF0747 family)
MKQDCHTLNLALPDMNVMEPLETHLKKLQKTDGVMVSVKAEILQPVITQLLEEQVHMKRLALSELTVQQREKLANPVLQEATVSEVLKLLVLKAFTVTQLQLKLMLLTILQNCNFSWHALRVPTELTPGLISI